MDRSRSRRRTTTALERRGVGKRFCGSARNYFFLPVKMEAIDLALLVTIPPTSAVM